jgi:hypothetical protein
MTDWQNVTPEELRTWYDRSTVEWNLMRVAELRFHEATSTGPEGNILAASDELGMVTRDARAFAIADPCPDPVSRENFLGMIEVWSEVVGLVQTIAADPETYEDGGESRLNALHARMNAHEETIDGRRKEIFGDSLGS